MKHKEHKEDIESDDDEEEVREERKPKQKKKAVTFAEPDEKEEETEDTESKEEEEEEEEEKDDKDSNTESDEDEDSKEEGGSDNEETGDPAIKEEVNNDNDEFQNTKRDRRRGQRTRRGNVVSRKVIVSTEVSTQVIKSENCREVEPAITPIVLIWTQQSSLTGSSQGKSGLTPAKKRTLTDMVKSLGVPGATASSRDITKRPQKPTLESSDYDTEILAQNINSMEHKEWDDPELVDYWSSQTYPLGKWSTEPPTPEEAAQSLVKISPEAISQGYNFEINSNSVPDKSGWGDYKLPIVRYDNDIRYSNVFFTGTHNEHYVVPEVPCTISISKEGSVGRAIVRTRKEDLRVLIPADNTRKALKSYVEILKDKKTIKVKRSKERLKKELLKFEKMEVRTNFKFGLVYCKEDENDEDNLFGASGGSPAYEEFLDFIGDRITLRGWDKYRGGLDVKNDDTGKESVYTTHKIYEVMFHVCTMLPVLGIDTQKVERKRHIGNDVVVLVFKEQSSKDDKFNPLIFTSHFIHCIFVVTPEVVESDKESTYYRLSVANKPGVPTYPPFLPENPVFKKGKEFQEFLIAKMINAERAAYASPEFASLYTSRRERLDLLCKEFAADDPSDN